METRALSVGDYLWVLRKIDGTEVVLDWVVERKTWHDLQQSIRLVGSVDTMHAKMITFFALIFNHIFFFQEMVEVSNF